jgi:hypothetical protein
MRLEWPEIPMWLLIFSSKMEILLEVIDARDLEKLLEERGMSASTIATE